MHRTKTWKESPDPEREAKLGRIEQILNRFPDRVFAFDEFGPLGIRPTAGADWAGQGHPDRVPASYHRTHGVRYFQGCYSVGDDTLWGVNRGKKGAASTLVALKWIRAVRADGAPIYVILDNLSAHKGTDIRRWAKMNKVELCFTPTYASWANPIEAHFGPLDSSPSPTPSTPTTPSIPGPCTLTCAGVMPTPAAVKSWPPNAENAPASAARSASVGADFLSRPRPDPTGDPMRSQHHRSSGEKLCRAGGPGAGGASTPRVADLQSSEPHSSGDPDPRPAGAGAPPGLVERVLPPGVQILDVDDRVARHRDLGLAGAELQLDVDYRMLENGPGQVEVHPSECGLGLEHPRYPPCAARWIRPPTAAIVDVVPAFSSGSEARTDTSSLCVLAVSTWSRPSSISSCEMCPSAYASCRRCTDVSRASSLISDSGSSGREVTVSL